MDKRKNNGGHSTKGLAGRKPKVEEQLLIEKLTPLETIAFDALKKGLKENQNWAVKLFFDYKFGKPKERVDITTNEESINIPIIKFFNAD